MTDRFAAKSEVVAFLTPTGQRGAVHSDPTDVYVVQLEGTKRWQIWPTPQVRRPGEDKDSFPSLPEPDLDLSLQPGDVLYIPHNTPHRASAEGSVSLHLTVVAGPRTWAHHLLVAVQDIAAADGIDAGTKLLAVPGAATFRDVTGGGPATVTILSNTLTMPEAAAAALRSASTAVPFPAGEFLPGAESRRALAAARQFLRLGALKIAS